MDPERHTEYDLTRFVTEIMNALSTVWLLELPRSSAWIQDNFLPGADPQGVPLRLSPVWDLPRALAQAAALTQTDQRLRLYWLRLCKDAARSSLRDMIDPALSGLSNLPDAQGQGTGPALIAGLARFGAELATTPRDQRDFLRRWRALKARFPRTGKAWRGLWQAPLNNRQYRERPFIDWLKETEPALNRRWTGAVLVSIPPNITGTIKDLRRRAWQPKGRPLVLAEAGRLLTTLEYYAEATGDAYFLVCSACNLGKEVLPWAPGHVLTWARDALRWSPNNGHAWDLSGRALHCLGYPDIAQAVYWEAVRRLPNDAVVRNQLARLLLPDQARMPEAEALLRRTLTDLPDDPITPYTLALLLISWGRPEEAAEIATHYVRVFGEDKWSTILRRLLNAGVAGLAEAQPYLAYHDPHSKPNGHLTESTAEIAWREAALKGERRSVPFLRRAAAVGRADILFRVRDTRAAERILDELLKDDPGNLYPQVVWALHTPARRATLAARYRETLGALAPHLAAGPAQTPAAHWERLYDEFPERRGLIDFTRLMHTGPTENIAERLEDWIAAGKDDQDAFLRACLREAIARDGRIDPEAPGLVDLLNSSIRGEVDLGDSVLGEEAA